MPTLNEYKHLQETKGDIPAFLKRIQFECRDNGRTPFQWDTTANAGFSSGIPWLQVNKNYTSINRAAQEKDANSVLNYFRRMTQLRKENPVLVHGKYELLDKNNPAVYAYTREWKGSKVLVLLNFTAQQAGVHISMDLSKAKMLIGNYPQPGTAGMLRPYEAIIYQL